MNPRGRQVLLVRAGGRACALPVEHVVETLRPLPVTPLAGTPGFVLGAVVVRDEAMPVVSLHAFLGDDAPEPPTRFVVIRCGPRSAVLAVRGVLGVCALEGLSSAGVPLLDSAAGGAVEQLSVADGELLLVLRTGRVVPEEAWRALAEESRT